MSSQPFGACRDPFHCVTCSDEGVPMRVVALRGEGLAVCEDARGQPVEVMTTLVGPVAAGERVLVHAGTALARLAEEEPA